MTATPQTMIASTPKGATVVLAQNTSVRDRSFWPPLLWGFGAAAADIALTALGVIDLPAWLKPAVPAIVFALRAFIEHAKSKSWSEA